MCFVKHLILTFSVGLPAKINHPDPARRQPTSVISTITCHWTFFRRKGNLSTVFMGNSSKDVEFLLTVHLERFSNFSSQQSEGGLTS